MESFAEHKDIKDLRESNINEYFKLLTIHADNGCEECQKILADEMKINYDRKQNFDNELISFYENRVENMRNTASLYYLGTIYKFGLGVAIDHQKAINCHRTNICINNNLSSMVSLAYSYMGGDGVEIDYQKTMYYCEIVEKQDPSKAANVLGCIYENGRGVPVNGLEAIRYFKLGVRRGFLNSMHRLGYIYNTGKIVPKNYHKAIKYYKMAVKNGCASSAYNLGIMHEKGQGLNINWNKAVKYYRLSVKFDGKLAIALIQLGKSLEDVLCMDTCQSKSLSYYERAKEDKKYFVESLLGCARVYTKYSADQDFLKAKENLMMIPDDKKKEHNVEKMLKNLYTYSSGLSIYDNCQALRFYASDPQGNDSVKQLIQHIMTNEIPNTHPSVTKLVNKLTATGGEDNSKEVVDNTINLIMNLDLNAIYDGKIPRYLVILQQLLQVD